MFLACVAFSGACTCAAEIPQPLPPGVIACKPQHPTRATVPAAASEVETVAVGSVPASFSVTSGGQAALLMRFRPVPGGALVPEIGLTYSSGGGDGIAGAGFSLNTGSAAITRCPKNLAQDGEIREVRYSLPVMLRELQLERTQSYFAKEIIDQVEISKIFAQARKARAKRAK